MDVHCVFQSYQSFPLSDPKFFDLITNDKAPVWRKMVFGLTYFHAAVQERIKYGPLGWNIPYQFSDPDLKISLRQLQSFLLEFPDNIPFKVIISSIIWSKLKIEHETRVKSLIKYMLIHFGGQYFASKCSLVTLVMDTCHDVYNYPIPTLPLLWLIYYSPRQGSLHLFPISHKDTLIGCLNNHLMFA